MRIAGAVWVFAFLVWLPFEDTQIGMTAVLAAAGVAWLAFRLRPWDTPGRWQAALGGGLLGAAIPALAVSLMAFKSGLHGHGFPDFTARQVWLAIASLPISAVFGLLVSLGARTLSWGVET